MFSWPHLHLLINHAPVGVLLCGLGLLVAALLRKDRAWKDASLWLLAAAGVAAFLVYVTGEPAADSLTHALSPAARAAVEAHEGSARYVFGVLTALTTAALAALFHGQRGEGVPDRFLWPVALLGLVALGVLTWTSFLGGRIIHRELDAPPPASSPSAPG